MKTPFPWRLFVRVVLLQAAVVVLALGAAGLSARYFFEKQFLSQASAQLHDVLISFSNDLPKGPDLQPWCRLHARGTTIRLTVIDASETQAYGTVLCDSHADPAQMENHGGRDEVIQARKQGFATDTRRSRTLHENLMYGALFAPERGIVLRASLPVSILAASLRVFDFSLGLIILLVALATGAFTVWTGGRLIIPVGRLISKTHSALEADENGEPPVTPDTFGADAYGELSELELSIDRMSRDLAAKNETLHAEREELSTVMGSISDAILAVDPEGVPMFYNSRFLLLFGTGHEERLRSHEARLWELFRSPEILDSFKRAIKERKTCTIGAVELPLSQGNRYFSLAVSPLRKRSGDPYGAVGIFHDVSELKNAEQIRIDFVANVSHELRTPLTSIKGYTDTLLQCLRQGRPIDEQFLQVISRNSDRLMNLLGDLLDLSSLESSKETSGGTHRQPVGTRDLTERVLQQLEEKRRQREQTIEWVIDAPTVHGESERIEQVLINLLDNAIKYTQPGGLIKVSWEKSEHGTLLKVSDNGPGIAQAHQPRLFERFYRVDKARSREQGGTGLGLAIVKHIVQRHGGSVSVESQPGHGASFSCLFPN